LQWILININNKKYPQLKYASKTPFIFSYRYYCFVLGMLFGIAVRSGSPLSLNIAEPVWKQLAGMPALTISDLSEVDKDFVPGMMYMYIIKDFLGSTVYVKKIKITICNLCTVM
jgi:hypothetical protein